ncbi:hypothetical protein ABN028_19425 [Actinopolymorpha sp. B17G11]|uniref:hypothetical protein n=1 Tax=Actinopolymorpha sp. B17G11 TaxID=3160861 RepID=UPI0032E505E6
MPADFIRVPLRGGGTRVDLTRLTDGQVMCCICFGFYHRRDLHIDDQGVHEDVCKHCAAVDGR